MTRWVASRKAALIRAIDAGELSLENACAEHALSIEEFISWRTALRDFGQPGLRTTKLQLYGNRPRRRKAREINSASDQGDVLMPHRKGESYEERRERMNAYERERQRQKRMADPEYRKRYNAYQREWQREHREEVNTRRRERYYTDLEYREPAKAGRSGKTGNA